MPSNRSVKNNPGAIAFTRIPNSPTSFASRRVRPRIAALAVAYGTPVTGLALLPPIDEKVTIDANHPLAGKKLIFDLEVVSVN